MKNKEANFQILKIAAMLMIVSHHLVAKNAFNIDTQVIGITGNKLALQILGNNAFIGNNLFFLVSAWFLSKKPDESGGKFSKIVLLLLGIAFLLSVGVDWIPGMQGLLDKFDRLSGNMMNGRQTIWGNALSNFWNRTDGILLQLPHPQG